MRYSCSCFQHCRYKLRNNRYRNYKNGQDKLHNEWLERKKARDEKISRGEDGGPEERDTTSEVEIGFFSLLKFLIYALIIAALAGNFVTGSYTWEYEGKWVQLKTYWPVRDIDSFTLRPFSLCGE